MKKMLLTTVLVLAGCTAYAHQGNFSGYFVDRTMRIDLFHTGGMGTEIVALDRIVADGVWPGSKTRLIDDTNLGHYLVEVIDLSSNRVIYTRGFATIFGEWETTGEAKRLHRTYHESLRIPWPRAAVQVVLKKRQSAGGFAEIWTTNIDPDSRFVNPVDLAPLGKVWTLFENGAPERKVDLLLIGEGYTSKEMKKFHHDAERLTKALFETEPFKSRKKDFNVRAIDIPAQSSGVSQPRADDFNRTPVSLEYNIFDSERYLLTYDNRALRDVASAAPYDFIEILVNEEQYGGGGIFNFQATTSVDTAFAEYVFIHEFGHHFAALADEYYTSPVAYETGGDGVRPEPWEPNVTALNDPDKLKWQELVAESTPLPTPWPKEHFEETSRNYQKRRAELRAANTPESEMNKLFYEVRDLMTPLLGEQEYSNTVGAFEGASYEATGLYRPEMDCIMFTRDDVGFCRVCSAAIEAVIDLYSE
ncbi:MAG: IgA Peptidase M64 [Gammaproteobacteria bacterium]|nr:IgA Peptidase M64 [Gammaproteobacteria bacterium]MDH3769002.1 IgA Peptidase M64 [Gammaproteobacteria bacterium]